MFAVSSFNFRSIMPIIAISKYGELGFGNNHIRNTNSANRLLALVGNAQFIKGLLKHNLNRSIDMRLMLPCFIKLCFTFRCPHLFFMASRHKSLCSIRERLAPSIDSLAFSRAKLLLSAACASGWLTTYKALVRGSFTEARQLLASIRTEALRWLGTPAIKWVVFLIAIITEPSYLHSHTCIIPHLEIEEKYYEIAAKRCSQGILELVP